MSNAVLTFKPSQALTVTQYDVTFSVNGTVSSPLVLTMLNPDSNGNLAMTSAPLTLDPGDVVGASVVAVDAVHGLSSHPAVATSVTMPFAQPDAPVIVSLTVA